METARNPGEQNRTGRGCSGLNQADRQQSRTRVARLQKDKMRLDVFRSPRSANVATGTFAGSDNYGTYGTSNQTVAVDHTVAASISKGPSRLRRGRPQPLRLLTGPVEKTQSGGLAPSLCFCRKEVRNRLLWRLLMVVVSLTGARNTHSDCHLRVFAFAVRAPVSDVPGPVGAEIAHVAPGIPVYRDMNQR